MKRTLLILSAVIAVAVPGLTAQQPAGAVQRRAVETALQAAGTARVALETRVTRGKPYTADAVTEFIQVLADGNRIVRRTSARLSRDTEGRTRREELTEAGTARESSNVVITDPVAGTSFVLDARTRTAFRSPAMFARVQPAPLPGGGTAVVQVGPTTLPLGHAPKVEVLVPAEGEAKRRAEATGQFTLFERGPSTSTFSFSGAGGVVPRGESTKEDLGEQIIDGVTATGTRTTTVIPAGAIGNEQPITITSEQWFSPDLEMLLLTRHTDPRVGETTYRLTNIMRHEPDRSLFQVPSDYTVQDRRPVMMRRQQ